MMQYVVIVDRSAGNESVGEMWKETRVFGPESTLAEAMAWAEEIANSRPRPYEGSRLNVTLTRAHQSPTPTREDD